MINYTERLTLLMQDIVTRVPTLSFIDIADVLVFARAGRSNAEGAFATCHCLTLPASEPGYYFWRDRANEGHHAPLGMVRDEIAAVTIGTRQVKYMISFALPRFCDQSLDRSRKERLYPGAEPWIAKLDTVVHELYHIDPELGGIRRIEREDGTYSANCHGDQFFEQVAEMVHAYLAHQAVTRRVRIPARRFRGARDPPRRRRSARASGRFRRFRSGTSSGSPEQPPCEADTEAVKVEPLRVPQLPTRYTRGRSARPPVHEDTSRRLIRKGAFRAA